MIDPRERFEQLVRRRIRAGTEITLALAAGGAAFALLAALCHF